MIDVHLHLQDCLTESSAEEIIRELREIGITILSVNGTAPRDWETVSDLAGRFDEVIPSFGVHPWKVGEVGPDWREVLEAYLGKNPGAGVGEIGLDKWIEDYDLPKQKEFFRAQLELAASYRRPASIHCLQAWGSLFECIEQSPYTSGFLLHSYGGPVEMVPDWVRLGAFFSISGYFFREDKAKKLKTFEAVPEDRVLLETDAPDMELADDQVRYRGRGIRNHPGNLEVVYDLYGRWADAEKDEVRTRIERNFESFRTFKPIRS